MPVKFKSRKHSTENIFFIALSQKIKPTLAVGFVFLLAKLFFVPSMTFGEGNAKATNREENERAGAGEDFDYAIRHSNENPIFSVLLIDIL